MTDILCCAGALITEHSSTKFDAVGWELDVSLGSVRSAVHNWTPEKCTHDGHKSCHMEPYLLNLKHYAYQGQQFLQTTVTRNERLVNGTTKTEKYLMWKHIISSKKDIKSIAISKDGQGISLTSVSQSLFNGRNPNIIFHIPGHPYISECLQAKEI
jgi:hypothetical protein